MTVDQICFKTRGRVFQTLKRVFQTLDRGFTEEIESSVSNLFYNTVHAVSVNYGIMFEKKLKNEMIYTIPIFLWNNRSSQNSCKSLTKNITKDLHKEHETNSFVNTCQSFLNIETWRLKNWKRIQKNNANTISTEYIQITYRETGIMSESSHQKVGWK